MPLHVVGIDDARTLYVALCEKLESRIEEINGDGFEVAAYFDTVGDHVRRISVQRGSQKPHVLEALFQEAGDPPGMPNSGQPYVSLTRLGEENFSAETGRYYFPIRRPERPVDVVWIDRYGDQEVFSSAELATSWALELREYLASLYRGA